jgi:hypothetical protein
LPGARPRRPVACFPPARLASLRAMEAALAVLAAIGFFVVAWRLVKAVLRLARLGLDVYAAGELADTRARRGDLTGMEEAKRAAAARKRARWRMVAPAVVWLLLLVLPALTPWTRSLYASYTLFWVLGRLRRGPVGVGPDPGSQPRAS